MSMTPEIIEVICLNQAVTYVCLYLEVLDIDGIEDLLQDGVNVILSVHAEGRQLTGKATSMKAVASGWLREKRVQSDQAYATAK